MSWSAAGSCSRRYSAAGRDRSRRILGACVRDPKRGFGCALLGIAFALKSGSCRVGSRSPSTRPCVRRGAAAERERSPACPTSAAIQVVSTSNDRAARPRPGVASSEEHRDERIAFAIALGAFQAMTRKASPECPKVATTHEDETMPCSSVSCGRSAGPSRAATRPAATAIWGGEQGSRLTREAESSRPAETRSQTALAAQRLLEVRSQMQKQSRYSSLPSISLGAPRARFRGCPQLPGRPSARRRSPRKGREQGAVPALSEVHEAWCQRA